MERKKHIEEMFNAMINDVDYIKLSTYQMGTIRKNDDV